VAIRATISLRQVQASTSVIKVEAQTTYQNSSATGIWVDPDSNNRFVSDEIPLSEVLVNVFSKVLTDTAIISEQYASDFTKLPSPDLCTLLDTFVKVVSYHRDFSDAFTLDDISQIDKDFFGNKGNIFGVTDVIGLTQNKVLTDSYTFSDVVSVSLTFYRDWVDSFSFTDVAGVALSKAIVDAFTLDDSASINKNFYGNKGNNFSFTETLAFIFEWRREYSDTFTFTDSTYTDVSKVFADSIQVFDDHMLDGAINSKAFSSLLNSPANAYTGAKGASVGMTKPTTETMAFSDISLRGVIKNLDESLTFTDEYGLQLEKSVNDAFTLDDAALVDKDFFGNKGNVLGVSDVFSRAVAFSRAYTDSYAVSDDSALNTTKSATDSLSFSEVFAKSLAYSRTFTDSTSFIDSEVKELDKGLSDTASILVDTLALTPSKELSDGFTFTDSNTLQLEKSISDGIGLDDAALVNKNYYGNKGNVVGISDVVAITHIKSNMLNLRVLNTMSLN